VGCKRVPDASTFRGQKRKKENTQKYGNTKEKLNKGITKQLN
jgi:hypothetical protein